MLDVLPNLYRPGELWCDGVVPLRLRDDTEDIDVFRPSDTGWNTGALALAFSGRERLLTDGERFREKPDCAETIDIASESFPARSDGVGERALASIGEDRIPDAVASGTCPGARCRRTSVLSSSPLKASSSRRPSASISSISSRISFVVCNRSSSSRVSMMLICAIRALALSVCVGKEDGGRDGARLILRASDRNICEAGVRRGEPRMLSPS